MKVYKRDGKRFTLSDVMEKTGLQESGARRRLLLWIRGKISIDDLFSSPNIKRQYYCKNGVKFTPKQISELTGITVSNASKRLKRWEENKITTKELLMPPRIRAHNPFEMPKSETKIPEPKWAKEELKKIPGPTEVEKRMEKEGLL